jgi:uncharacterized OB-fold protein
MELTGVSELPATGERTRIDATLGALVGSRCDDCGAVSWPSRTICHRCGMPAMRETVFSSEGQLLTYTTVWVARPGIEPPYTIGQVKLDDGPLVFGHVRGLVDGTTVPAPVQMVVSPEVASIPPFWFEPEEVS